MLAILGGTGPEGKGLALRLALAGESIIIGSRSPDRGAAAAAELTAIAPNAAIAGHDNAHAAHAADTVFLAFPYDGQRPVLEQLASELDGKIVVSVIAPMHFERGRGARAIEVAAGSAAQEAQELLPGAQIVAAFQNVSAEELQDPQIPMQGDVVVCLRPPRSQTPNHRPSQQNPPPPRHRRRRPSQRQIRRTNHPPTGKHQPHLPHPLRHQNNRHLTHLGNRKQ